MELEKLETLAQHFDPFKKELSAEHLKILKELKLDHLISDPFALSNELLKRLLVLEEERRRILH